MKEHLKRRLELSRDIIPAEGTEEFKKFEENHNKLVNNNPKYKKHLKDSLEKAKNTLIIQSSNGINIGIDKEIRHFLGEFNSRAWSHGLRSMPAMFNILEAFFHHDKSIHYFQLLDEEDYLISFYDFIDYYTSSTLDENILNTLENNIEDDFIYNYNVGSDINEITFKTEDGNEFIIGGFSLVKRGNEVTILFLCGEKIDTKEATEKLDKISPSTIPGKENLQPNEDKIRQAEMLNNDPNLWKVLIGCRIDLETMTLDSRYVAKDEGNAYAIITDDKSSMFKNGKFIIPELEETYKHLLIEIEKYNSIFELAKVVLHIPLYFNKYEEDIYEETHETNLKTVANNPITKRKFNNVDNKFKIRTRSLWILNRNNKFSSDRVILRDDKYKIETSGYWKELNPDDIGTDKQGRQISGKTWVNIKETYYEAKAEDLIITRKNNIFEGENAGYIYIMRNAYMERNVIKIGLTTKTTDERAQQLSKTSVPDRFYVLSEWAVKDCILAEKQIHEDLKDYRVDNRREFFEIEIKEAVTIINKVINNINNSEQHSLRS